MATNAEQAYEVWNAAIGQPAKTGEWLEIDQDRINQFADGTDDHQFIHVDPEKAARRRSGARSRTASSRCRC